MEEKTLTALEYDKVLSLVAEKCATPMGQERTLAARPGTSFEEVERRQRETTDARRRLETDGEPPWRGMGDIRPILQRTRRGDLLSADDLNQLAKDLTLLISTRHFILKSRQEDQIQHIAHTIADHSRLFAHIRWAVDEDGQILDRASHRLAQIRKEVRTLTAEIQSTVQQILRDPSWAKILQEPYVTVRDGRYCFPVKAEFKGSVSGIIHDRSSSGLTLFVEPDALVLPTNELRLLQQQEREEIHRILRDLTNRVAEEEPLLAASWDRLSLLDFIYARAKFSRDTRSWEPVLLRDFRIRLRQARHPLLQLQGFVVPIDVELGYEYDVLVITGPNTGGKTVALKTVGLLCLMAQTGLHIPAAEDSQLGVFERIVADIGDPQSLEESLSSFAGHVQTMIRLLEDGGSGTLALLDELGAGTDPEEGCALARSVLLTLQQEGVQVICTTHLTGLKVFAHSQPRVANASVLFDPVTLQPTYRLVVGVPGKSHAFDVARKLGLPEPVLRLAEEQKKGQEREWETMLESLFRERSQLEHDRRSVAALRQQLEDAFKEAEQIKEQARKEKEETVRKARKEATDLIRRLEAQVDELFRTARRQPHSSSLVKKEIRRLRDQVAALMPEAPVSSTDRVADWEEGMTVRIPELDLIGTIRSVDRDRQEVQVETQGLVFYVPQDRLEKAPASREKATHPIVRLTPPVSVPTELSLIGKRVAPALEELERFLDQALLAGHQTVRIVHGRGTGRLRQAVHDYLRTVPTVRGFELAPAHLGGDGATIVYLQPV